MKVIRNIIITAVFGILFGSCQSLDLDDQSLIGEEEYFQTGEGVKKYLTSLYAVLPTEHFTYFARNANYSELDAFNRNNAWEAVKYNLQNMCCEFVNGWNNVQANGIGYWPYTSIRNINIFITRFPDYKEYYKDEAEYNELLGEAHFLRAFYYFALVKRYGGVPLITEVQDPLADIETLAVHRATEYDTYKFIHDDLQFAIDNMTSTHKDRGSRYAAAALMSRAMLYAGTTAKYSHWLGFESEAAYQQGYAGISADKADEFFNWSVEASRLILEEGPYELYAANGAASGEEYAEMFRDINSKENIFIKEYATNTTDRLRHAWSAGHLPPDLSPGNAPQTSNVALDVLRVFGFPSIVDPSGYPIRYNDPGDIRNGYEFEPRMEGNFWLNGDEPFNQGIVLNCRRGHYKTFHWKADAIRYGNASDEPNLITDGTYKGSKVEVSNRILNSTGDINAEFYIDPVGGIDYPVRITDNSGYQEGMPRWRYTGRHGNQEGGVENNSVACTWVRKYVTAPSGGWVNETQHWIIFRLGEIYLNMAEALYELGEKDEAFDYIEAIRKRAGSKVVRPALDNTPYVGQPNDEFNPHTYPHGIDASLQLIREERFRELYAENHRWYDLRRWRIADLVLFNYRPRILSCYHLLDEDKYIYLEEQTTIGGPWNAGRQCYYEGIPQGQINRNPNLLPQNPLR
jgi:hypothetical protein